MWQRSTTRRPSSLPISVLDLTPLSSSTTKALTNSPRSCILSGRLQGASHSTTGSRLTPALMPSFETLVSNKMSLNDLIHLTECRCASLSGSCLTSKLAVWCKQAEKQMLGKSGSFLSGTNCPEMSPKASRISHHPCFHRCERPLSEVKSSRQRGISVQYVKSPSVGLRSF